MDWLAGAVPMVMLVLMCPLMMIFMMRRMHGGHGKTTVHRGKATDERVAALEQQVRDLSEERDRAGEKVA